MSALNGYFGGLRVFVLHKQRKKAQIGHSACFRAQNGKGKIFDFFLAENAEGKILASQVFKTPSMRAHQAHLGTILASAKLKIFRFIFL